MHCTGTALASWTALTCVPKIRDIIEQHRVAAPDVAIWHLGLPTDADPACVERTCARCAAIVGDGVHSRAAGNELGVDRKTLHKRLRAAGLPSAERVIGWSRRVLAVSVLDAPEGSMSSVAAVVGFSSGVPVRSWIPLLGFLFGQQGRTNLGTEFFLFLTPRIEHADMDIERLTQPYDSAVRSEVP